MKKRILWSITILALVAAASSGWIFNTVQDRSEARDRELATLQSAFAKQYGTDGITITQLVSPDKVYVAVWTDKDGTTHVSWNIGGLWVTVFSGDIPTTTP